MPIEFQFTPSGSSNPVTLQKVEEDLLSTLGLEEDIDPDHWHPWFIILRNIGTAACWESSVPDETRLDEALERIAPHTSPEVLETLRDFIVGRYTFSAWRSS